MNEHVITDDLGYSTEDGWAIEHVNTDYLGNNG